jgi:microcystin-dependent protein
VSIPANWHICDGTGGTPDLRDKFVVGAGSTYAVNAAGGSLTTTSDGAHNHTGATGGHTLALSEVPELVDSAAGSGTTISTKVATAPAATVAHTHPISTDGAHTHTATPPYLALAYIQRVS